MDILIALAKASDWTGLVKHVDMLLAMAKEDGYQLGYDAALTNMEGHDYDL